MFAGNSAYSPLPQSNSDSECSSEEELHVSQGNRIVNRTAKVQNSKGDKQYNEPETNVVNYKLLENDGDVGVNFNKFQSGPDDVSVVKPDGGLEIFSTSRKICFVFSLLLCVFTTVAFIWLLPCNVETCLSASDKNFTWEENFPNLEIHGPISLVSDRDGNQNLLFLTKSLFDDEKKSSKSGLQCLKGKNGFHAWNLKFNEEPSDIDCKLIDINADGVNDCLIFGKNFLKAVDPVSGKKLWDIQKSNKRLYFRDFPLIVSDLDRDEVKELLLPCMFNSSNTEEHTGVSFHNNLVIISGKTGVIINKPLQIKSCTSVRNIMLENSSVMTYSCIDYNEKESFQKLNFMKVYKTLKNASKESLNFPKIEMLKQHVGDSNTVDVNGFRVIVKNEGECPQDCDVLVDVLVYKDEKKKSSNNTVYSFRQKNTFGMAPVALEADTETGFILKFWKWDTKPGKPQTQKDGEYPSRKAAILKKLKSLTKRSKKLSLSLNSSKVLDREMLLESDWESQRLKRTASKLYKNDFGLNSAMRKGLLNSGIINMRVITETVVKITLNHTQFQVSNITEDEIVQICKKPEVCLPKPRNHRHSVMVARFDQDGNDKLIMFTSKYVHEKKEKQKDFETWQFRSRIRVLNL